MQKQYIAIIILIAITTGFVIEPSSAQKPEGWSFQVKQGRIALSRTGGSTWLILGPEPVNVKAHDMLRTEGGSRGELSFPGGDKLRLQSDTMVTLLPDGILLQVGDVWLSLRRREKPFQVVTPTTICTVLGTTFDVSVDKYGRTRVRTFEGIVSVKARDDQRHRQVVLQRGMQTTVQNRGFTSDQIQKFDASALEDQLQKAWENQTTDDSSYKNKSSKLEPAWQKNFKKPTYEPIYTEKPVSTPAQPGLPPIRPTLPGQLRTLGPDGQPIPLPPINTQETSTTERIDRLDEAPDVRSRLNFFENLRLQRMRERKQLSRVSDRPPTQFPASAWRSTYPGAQFGPNEPPGWNDIMRQGHGRLFGQAAPAPTGILDERMLRNEIQRLQERIVRLEGELTETEAERQTLLKKAEEMKRATTSLRNETTGEAMNLEQIQWRINELQNKLVTLYENHRQLYLLLSDLQNRLR